MLTNWIADLFEAAALQGILRVLKRLGVNGQPDNAATYAELDALMGRQPRVIETTATEPAPEAATEPSRRRR